MARPRTAERVHLAVLALVGGTGYSGVTMQGIAARAGVSKQTLYRTWSSPADILFDALSTRSTDPDGTILVPDSGDLVGDLTELVAATIAELTDPGTDRILRAVTAEIQTDPQLGARLQEQLLGPQLDAVRARLERGGIADATAGVELLYGPLFHRWLLRTAPFETAWPQQHVARVLRALTAGP